jgi:DnaA family protein
VTPHQFTLDLLALPTPTLDNFVPGANGAALAALRDVLAGRGPAYLHLWGPPGSGRSHLLAALRAAAGARVPPAQAVAPAADGPGNPPAMGPAPDGERAAAASVSAFAGPGIYLADDVHRLDAAGQAKLFGLQNAVRQANGAFLVTTADRPPAHLALREDVRSRLAWGLVFALHPIAESDQAAALAAYARARGARVDDDLVPYMLSRLPRDMRSLVSVLDALDAFALSRQRALTVPLLREWLQASGAGSPAAQPVPGAGGANGGQAGPGQ